MNSTLIEIMRDRVSNIYRAATGSAMAEPEPSADEPEASLEEVTRSFAELEVLTRTIPSLAERVPPFSFTPALDALLVGDDLVIEVAVPGIDRKDVTVECVEDTLIVSGVRRGHCHTDAQTYSHGEIPCGPFYRRFHVPFPIQGEPAVELSQGLLRVRLKSLTAQDQKEDSVDSSEAEENDLLT